MSRKKFMLCGVIGKLVERTCCTQVKDKKCTPEQANACLKTILEKEESQCQI